MAFTTLVFYQNSKSMSGHEINKQHIAFKQNAKGNLDVNIKQYQSILSSIQKENKKQNKKNKQVETVQIFKD